MTKKPQFINKISTRAALIIISLSFVALILSVYLNRQAMRSIVLNEVGNKATIFLSSMETSVRRLVMEKDTKSLVELIQERTEFIGERLNFVIVGVIVRNADGVVLERKIKDPDGLMYDPGNPKDKPKDYIPKDFQEVLNSGYPLVKRQVKKLRMVEGQPEVQVIEALYPINKRQKGELLAVIKLVISVERTFALMEEEYKRFGMRVVIGLALVTIFLVTNILFYIRRRIILPVLSINDGADKVASGNLKIRLEPKGSNEISNLMLSFNKMVDGLRHRDQLRHSLEVAKEVQQNLLPHEVPDIDGLDISGKSIYCDETGGDYYDFIEYDHESPQKVGIVIGDVSGHGIPSALLMATTRAFLRQRAALPGSIAEIISDVNLQLSRDVADSGSFMSLFYLSFDKSNRSLQWVRAGHDPAIIYDPENDSISELKGTGIVLGVDKHHRFIENTHGRLGDGQIILLCTDGVWEARNRQGNMFGKEAIYTILRENAGHTADKIITKITDAIDQFQEGAPVEDDITLIVVKITPTF